MTKPVIVKDIKSIGGCLYEIQCIYTYSVGERVACLVGPKEREREEEREIET